LHLSIELFAHFNDLLTYEEAKDDVNQRIVWVDLEMSGLDVNKERIIEIAVAVTDAKLTKIAKVDGHCCLEQCLVKPFQSLVSVFRYIIYNYVQAVRDCVFMPSQHSINR